jgi:hypothetical protein
MPRSVKSNAFDFDEVYTSVILPHFEELEEQHPRRSNARFKVNQICRAGFAIYSLKSSSLLDFRPKTEAEVQNLATCFGIKKLPSDNGLRDVLDVVDHDKMRSGLDKTMDYLRDQEVLDDYLLDGDYLVFSVDGVKHYSSKSLHCDCCLTRHHRDGTTTYQHQLLAAALVKPGAPEVFVVDAEPIVQQDGHDKNDCERTSAKRLLDRMASLYSSERVVYAMDALYGCAPIIELITQASPSWSYVINAKVDGHKHLVKQFNMANENDQVHWQKRKHKGEKITIGYCNRLSLNAANPEVKTNFVVAYVTDKKGKETTFMYMTNLTVTTDSVMRVLDIGRSRWKVENEVFNTLKNQQYNFEHNFGHGKKNTATNFAYLMLLAFNVDQIRQYGSRLFRSIWKGLKSKKATWDAIRTVFKMVIVDNLNDLCRKVMSIYELRAVRV